MQLSNLRTQYPSSLSTDEDANKNMNAFSQAMSINNEEGNKLTFLCQDQDIMFISADHGNKLLTQQLLALL